MWRAMGQDLALLRPFAPKAVTFLGLSSSDTPARAGNSVCTRMFIVNAKDKRQEAPECLPVGGWVGALWESFGGYCAGAQGCSCCPYTDTDPQGLREMSRHRDEQHGENRTDTASSLQGPQGAESWEGTQVTGKQRQSLFTLHLATF